MVIIIRLPEISDDTDAFPIMNILVISDEQKAAVRCLWHQASLTETAVCLEPRSNMEIIVHQRVHHSSYCKALEMLCQECFLWTCGTLKVVCSGSLTVIFTVTNAFEKVEEQA